MATEMKRLTLSLTPEIEKKLDELKKGQFYNKSHAEMLRTLISQGLESLEHSNAGAHPHITQ